MRFEDSPVPKQIQIEITTRCNYACVMCPHGLGGNTFVKRDAPIEIVDRVIDMIDRVDSLHPTGLGEPLMADGFWKIVDALAGRQKPSLTFHTNGLLLTPANIERILKAPVAHIVLSMDAASPRRYARIRGGNFPRIIENAERLARRARELDKTMMLQLAMVLMVENYFEAADFVRLAKDIGFNVVSFDHLMNPSVPEGAWQVSKQTFAFDYHKQRILPGTPHAQGADRAVLEALDVADRLGIQVGGLGLFAALDAAAYNDRPSRRYASPHYSGTA